MIPWWGWLALWASLALVLLIVLALSAWLLFRKFLRVLDAFGHLANSTAVFDGVGPVIPASRLIAIIEPFAKVRARYSARRLRAKQLAKIRHDRRLARARALIAADWR